jgi:nicotinamide-nucleotide amidase
MTRAENLLAAYRAAGRRIATAESCTGGLLAGALTDPAGASDVFDRGFVTYSNEAKSELLGVRRETLITHGAVSEEVAVEMAQGALQRSGADTVVSVTGIAGPGPSEFKPEGRVCFAVMGNTGVVISETREFGAIGRAEVRRASVERALELLAEVVS